MIQSIFHLEHYIAYLFSFINLGIFAQFSWQNPWKGWGKANEDEQSRGTLCLDPKIFTIFDQVRIYTDCGFINLSMEHAERRGDDRAELQHCRRLFYFRLIFRSFNLGSEKVLRKLLFGSLIPLFFCEKNHGNLRAALLPANVHLFIRRTLAGVLISDLPPCVAKDNSYFVKGIASEWKILWLSILNNERASFHEFALIAKCKKVQFLCSMHIPWLYQSRQKHVI